MTNRKRAFTISFLSLVFLFSFSFMVVHADTQIDLKNGIVPCSGSSLHTGSGPGPADKECGFEEFIALFNRVIVFLLFYLAAPLAVVSFVYAGFMYMTAAGDTGKISKAHDIFKNVLIGMVLAFGAYLIVTAILKGLEVDSSFTKDVIQQ
jgi:hypothetical protein